MFLNMAQNLSDETLGTMLNSTPISDATTKWSTGVLPGCPNSTAILAILNRMNEEEAVRQIPLTIFLGILSVTGLFGNLLVCYIYGVVYKVSNSRVFITCLAVVDLCTCAFALPVEIVTVLNQYQFDAQWTCKMSRFTNGVTTVSSASVLVLIAVDRFRKICRSLKWQISNKNAKALCCGAVSFGIFISWPNIILYGVKSTEKVLTPTLNGTGTECSIDDDFSDSPWPLIYSCVSLFIFVAALGLLVVLYFLIGRKVRFFAKKSEKRRGSSNAVLDTPGRDTMKRRREKLNELQGELSSYDDIDDSTSHGKRSNGTLKTVKSIETVSSSVPVELLSAAALSPKQDIEYDNATDDTKRNTLSYLIKTSQNKLNNISSPWKKTHKKRRRLARNTTYLMFIISVVFISSFVPHLTLILLRQVMLDFVNNLDDNGRTAYRFFLRSYFINAAANPIVYSIFDERFRKAAKASFIKLFEFLRLKS